MQPRELARLSLLIALGALALAIAAWLFSFGLGGRGMPASGFFSLFALLGGVALLGIGLVLLGGAGADVVWSRRERALERVRERR